MTKNETYAILKQGEVIKSEIPGEYVGWAPRKIFGRLDCRSGMRMNSENRVFFHSLEDAVNEGYRPCKKCHPIDEKDFERIKNLVSYGSVEEWYDRDN